MLVKYCYMIVWLISYRSATKSAGAEYTFLSFLLLSPSLIFPLSFLSNTSFRGRYAKAILPRGGTRNSTTFIPNAHIVPKAQCKIALVKKNLCVLRLNATKAEIGLRPQPSGYSYPVHEWPDSVLHQYRK